MVRYSYYIIFLLAALLVACSSGSGGSSGTTNPPIGWGIGYQQFSESNITMQLGSTTQVTLSIIDSVLIRKPFPFSISESGVVTLNPDICSLDYNESPPSCVTTITAVGVGTAIISAPVPGMPLTVTVEN